MSLVAIQRRAFSRTRANFFALEVFAHSPRSLLCAKTPKFDPAHSESSLCSPLDKSICWFWEWLESKPALKIIMIQLLFMIGRAGQAKILRYNWGCPLTSRWNWAKTRVQMVASPYHGESSGVSFVARLTIFFSKCDILFKRTVSA